MGDEMAEEPDLSWGGLVIRRNNGATSPMAPPAPNKIVRPTARQTGLRKVPNVVFPQEETAVVDTTTDKEPAVLANTRKEPVVVATTTRHQQ